MRIVLLTLLLSIIGAHPLIHSAGLGVGIAQEGAEIATKQIAKTVAAESAEVVAEQVAKQVARQTMKQIGKEITSELKELLSMGAKKLSTAEARTVLSAHVKGRVMQKLELEVAEQIPAKLLATLEKQVIKLTPTAAERLLGSVALQMALPFMVFFSYGLNTEWLSEEDAKEFAKGAEEQKKIESDFNNFLLDQDKKQGDKIAKSIADYIKAQQQLSEKYAKSTKRIQQEIMYLSRSISMSMPKQLFLINPILMDQLFAHSIMLTPKSFYQWYNIAQYGNWQYSPQRDSFIQYETISLYPKEDPTNPEFSQNNAIFTEYATGASSYDIQIECTLHRISYPFFAGIMFNKARWISGDPERIRQFRLLGLYGTQTDAKKDITVRFAENFSKKGANNSLEMTSPMKQITSITNKPLLAFDEKLVAFANTNSVTFIIKIKTEPRKISYKLWQQGSPEPAQFTAIEPLNPYLFIYGGIGFISAGCQAEFRILQPERLRFTKVAVEQFTKDLPTLLKKST